MNTHNLKELIELKRIPAQGVSFTKQFTKDLKKLSKSGHYDLDRLQLAIELIRHKIKLPRGFDKHRLIYVNNEIDIHVSSDWVLLYKQKIDNNNKSYIKLYRTGPHNWIFK